MSRRSETSPKEFIMRRSIIALSAAFALAIPGLALADAPEPITFVHNGVDYNYTVAQEGQTRVLTGTANHGAVPFRLRVSGKRVSGTFNGQPIDFALRDVQHQQGIVIVAAR
jgi:hypothetical protein